MSHTPLPRGPTRPQSHPAEKQYKVSRSLSLSDVSNLPQFSHQTECFHPKPFAAWRWSEGKAIHGTPMGRLWTLAGNLLAGREKLPQRRTMCCLQDRNVGSNYVVIASQPFLSGFHDPLEHVISLSMKGEHSSAQQSHSGSSVFTDAFKSTDSRLTL